MTDVVLTEARQGVLLITLNRPEVRNAIDDDVVAGLRQAFADLDGSSDLSVGVLTGAGNGFCAGMDLKAFARTGRTPLGSEELYRHGAAKPLIAALEGPALAGGLELALICDIVVAARNARLGIPEVTVGLFAAGGGLIRLGQHLPLGRAMELALTGAPITGEEAFDAGLVTRLAEPGQTLEVAFELAARIAANAPLGVVASKQLIRASATITEEEAWEEQRRVLPAVFRSDDAAEGPRAFAEKRPPKWSGR